MIELNIGSLLIAFVAAMGIPTAITGMAVWRHKLSYNLL